MPSAIERINDYLVRYAAMTGAAIAPLDAQGETRIVRGSATVAVNVLEERGLLLLLAPILDAPKRNETELYRALLELNYLRTEEAAFAIDRTTGRIFLRAMRALDAVDGDGFFDLLDTVSRVADEWDDKLRAQFGV